MKSKKPVCVLLLITLTVFINLYLSSATKMSKAGLKILPCCTKSQIISKINRNDSPPKGCVFKTVFESEYNDSDFIHKTPVNVIAAIERALEWMVQEQLPDGGWSAGYHSFPQPGSQQGAKADPATTAMVNMAILRCGSDPLKGKYVKQLNRGTEFLLRAVERSTPKDLNITTLAGTQPQIKLGQNIDVMLTSQYLTNILIYFNENSQEKLRVISCIDKCVEKIQRAQNANGSFTGAGWAGVLQSSIANNALETAVAAGIRMDTAILERSRQ